MIFLQLFWTFFKIGLFTFGGGYAMLPLIEAEVTAQGWMTRQALVDFVAVSESTPGPFAVNIATYVGSCTAGSSGAGMALRGAGAAAGAFLSGLLDVCGHFCPLPAFDTAKNPSHRRYFGFGCFGRCRRLCAAPARLTRRQPPHTSVGAAHP